MLAGPFHCTFKKKRTIAAQLHTKLVFGVADEAAPAPCLISQVLWTPWSLFLEQQPQIGEARIAGQSLLSEHLK